MRVCFVLGLIYDPQTEKTAYHSLLERLCQAMLDRDTVQKKKRPHLMDRSNTESPQLTTRPLLGPRLGEH